MLTWLLLHPDREASMSDLALRLNVPLTTLHREAQRLIDAQLLLDRTVGRSRLLRANPAHRATAPLTELLTVTFGPHVVVAEEFAGVADVDRVLIYGSWAARYAGESGGPPADLDILVVGAPHRADVYEAADRVQERLAMPVNPVIRTPQQWAEAADALIAQVKASAMLSVTHHGPVAA